MKIMMILVLPLEGLLARVRSDVNDEVVLLGEPSVAVVTAVWLLTGLKMDNLSWFSVGSMLVINFYVVQPWFNIVHHFKA
jgi:hypothetical protein